MALLMFDGFDYLSPTFQLGTPQVNGRGWTLPVGGSVPTRSGTPGRFGGGCLSMLYPLAWNLASAAPTLIAGVAINPGGGQGAVLEFGDGATCQIGVGYNNSIGRVFIYTPNTSTIIATGATPILQNTWNYLEFKATMHDTSGSYELRLNGLSTPELIASGIKTTTSVNNYANVCRIVANACLLDDFYLLDTSGGLSSFLGDVRVQSLYPTADGSSVQWAPLAGTNWQSVDDAIGLDSDTTYVSSVTAGQVDLFQMQDISGAPEIFAVQVAVDAKKDDGGLRQVRCKLKTGATVSNGSSHALGSGNYANYVARWNSEPTTGSPWSAFSVNNAEAGYENV